MTGQEAIKILNKYDLNFCDIDGNPIPPQDLAEAFDMAIKALEQESSEDAVSRKALLDKAYAYGNGLEPEGYCVDVEDIQELSPVAPTRKKGEWIRNDNGTCSCSLCQSWIPEEQYHYARFCLHCGVRME